MFVWNNVQGSNKHINQYMQTHGRIAVHDKYRKQQNKKYVLLCKKTVELLNYDSSININTSSFCPISPHSDAKEFIYQLGKKVSLRKDLSEIQSRFAIRKNWAIRGKKYCLKFSKIDISREKAKLT